MSILRDYDELTAMEKLSLVSMSYSRLNTYQSCPAKYFYTYIQKEPRSFGAAAAMGTAVHAVLEKTDLNELDLDALLLSLEDEFIEADPKGEMDDELKEAARLILHEFVDRHEGETFQTIAKEMDFNVIIGNANFVGYIDRVDRTPTGGILIQDYKAGKWQETQKSIPTNLQLGMYAVVCRKRFPDLWPIRGELYYLREGKMKGHTYASHAELDEMEERILGVSRSIIEQDFFKYTPNKFTCLKMCDFGKNGVCPRGKTVCGTW